MDFPLAVRPALGDAGLALVQQLERGIAGVADFAPGRGRDAADVCERGVDGGFEGGERHRDFLGRICLRRRGFFGIWRRRVKALPGTVPFGCHHPRKRVIQYSETPEFWFAGRGVLDTPLSRGMTA